MPSEGIIAISGGNGALGLVMGTWLLTRAEQQVKASGGAYKPNFSIQPSTQFILLIISIFLNVFG